MRQNVWGQKIFGHHLCQIWYEHTGIRQEEDPKADLESESTTPALTGPTSWALVCSSSSSIFFCWSSRSCFCLASSCCRISCSWVRLHGLTTGTGVGAGVGAAGGAATAAGAATTGGGAGWAETGCGEDASSDWRHTDVKGSEDKEWFGQNKEKQPQESASTSSSFVTSLLLIETFHFTSSTFQREFGKEY